MKTTLTRAAAAIMALALPLTTAAYPPAPPHEIHGMVRGEDGEPIVQSAVIIALTTAGGVQVTGYITPGVAPGENYRLPVPMDAGVTPDPYVPNALMPLVPFRITVVIGTTTNLPIEMTGDFRSLGQPGGSTRIDLTLGVDSDGDGLPDAWENLVIALLGGGKTLADITPGGDADGDGLSNWQEYIAGTYAFDAEDTFALTPKTRGADVSVLEFLAIRGRTYTIQRSPDLETWEDIAFRVPLVGAELHTSYWAPDVRFLEIEVPDPAPSEHKFYYRGGVR